MCIAIYRPAGAKALQRDMLKRCSTSNPHGMGVMWPQEGKIQMFKSMNDFDGFYQVIQGLQYMDVPMVLHFRYATHGSKSYANCHPFYVPNTEGELGVVHNGVISAMPDCKRDRSDTRVFVDEVLGILQGNWMESPAVKAVLEEALGYNKVVVMKGNGDVLILNRQKGVEHEGSWYSNSGFRPYASTGGWQRGNVRVWTSDSYRYNNDTASREKLLKAGTEASSSGAKESSTSKTKSTEGAETDAEIIGFYDKGGKVVCLTCAADEESPEDLEDILASNLTIDRECDTCKRDLWEAYVEIFSGDTVEASSDDVPDDLPEAEEVPKVGVTAGEPVMSEMAVIAD